jgi:hypothetical protein
MFPSGLKMCKIAHLGGRMTIHRILQNTPFGPEDIKLLVSAHERTLRKLGLKDRNDPLTEMVAKTIIEIRQTGISDPVEISQLAIKQLGLP